MEVKSKLAYLVYSEGTQNLMTPQGPKINITSPLTILTPLHIPGNFSFSITAGFMGVDTHQSNSLQVIFKAPNGDTIQDTGRIELPPSQDPKKLPPEYEGINISLDFRNVPLLVPGVYTTSIILNEKAMGDFQIPVMASENDGRSNL